MFLFCHYFIGYINVYAVRYQIICCFRPSSAYLLYRMRPISKCPKRSGNDRNERCHNRTYFSIDISITPPVVHTPEMAQVSFLRPEEP